jgi:putative transcriptional regulator
MTNDLKTWEENRDLGMELLQAVGEMKSGKAGNIHKVAIQPIVEARIAAGFSQADFARLLGVSKRTLQEWEQGRRKPSKAAMTLLRIALKRPDILQELVA